MGTDISLNNEGVFKYRHSPSYIRSHNYIDIPVSTIVLSRKQMVNAFIIKPDVMKITLASFECVVTLWEKKI